MIDLTIRNPTDIWKRQTIPHSGNLTTFSGRWFHTDNPEMYAKQGNKAFGPNDIYYAINSLGYRTKEVSQIDHTAFKIMVMGCSVTLGVGLPIEMTYGEILAEKLREKYHLNVEVINLAMGARSIDYVARVLYQAVPVLRPHYVFCLFPDPLRREYVHLDRGGMIIADHFGIYSNAARQPHDEALLSLATDEWDFFSCIKNLSFIELILRDYRWSWDCWSFFFREWQEWQELCAEYIDPARFRRQFMLGLDRGLARDSLHYGLPYHRFIADDLWLDSELHDAVVDYFNEPSVVNA